MGKKNKHDLQVLDSELVMLRVKLEQRSWFLRASLALNVALVAGLVVRIAT